MSILPDFLTAQNTKTNVDKLEGKPIGENWLKSPHQLRAIEWSASWTWDIQFPDAPEPFKKWFPATEIEEPKAILNTEEFTSPLMGFAIPKNSSVKELSITWTDDSRLTVEHWLSNWIKYEIFGYHRKYGVYYVASLQRIVKQVNIMKLNKQKEMVALDSYLVFPKDAIAYTGSSDVGLQSHSTSFVICGDVIGHHEDDDAEKTALAYDRADGLH